MPECRALFPPVCGPKVPLTMATSEIAVTWGIEGVGEARSAREPAICVRGGLPGEFAMRDAAFRVGIYGSKSPLVLFRFLSFFPRRFPGTSVFTRDWHFGRRMRPLLGSFLGSGGSWLRPFGAPRGPGCDPQDLGSFVNPANSRSRSWAVQSRLARNQASGEPPPLSNRLEID